MHSIETIRQEVHTAMEELLTVAKVHEGQLFVVGCSTSEICGKKIGTDSHEDVAAVVFDEIYKAVSERGLYLAVQCCEHLNRALVMEREAMTWEEECNIVPQLRAGGAEALAINDQRLIGTSEIRCSGPTITVNGKVYGAPFTVKAIGDPKTLNSALTMRGGIVDSLKHWGIKVTIKEEPSIAIPAFTGSYREEHLQSNELGGKE